MEQCRASSFNCDVLIIVHKILDSYDFGIKFNRSTIYNELGDNL